ncbi:MAG: hypothetical protein HYV52_00195 [Parcubacteria group bacterium]|nr:hypothetical protein [Parcubacteria group bacterium]
MSAKKFLIIFGVLMIFFVFSFESVFSQTDVKNLIKTVDELNKKASEAFNILDKISSVKNWFFEKFLNNSTLKNFLSKVRTEVKKIGDELDKLNKQFLPFLKKKLKSEKKEEEKICLALFDPVCGSNKQTYSNQCFAEKAGVKVDYKGECEKTGQK